MYPPPIYCPHCHVAVAVDLRFAGHVISCPYCRGSFQMPHAVMTQPPTPPDQTVGGLNYAAADDPPFIPARTRKSRSLSTGGGVVLVGVGLAVAAFIGVIVVMFSGKKGNDEAPVQTAGDIAPKAASQPSKQPPPPPRLPVPTPQRPKEPTQDEVTADFRKRITTFQAMTRERPWTSKGLEKYWHRTISTVYEFRFDVKASNQPGFAWVAEMSYKEVSMSTPRCETEELAKNTPLSGTPNPGVWEQWRLFGYRDGKWERIARKVRSSGAINIDWTEGVDTYPLLAIEDEFFSDRPR